MTIAEAIRDDRLTLSFEIFPPKDESAAESVLSAAKRIAALPCAYISVTWGAGGSNKERSLRLISSLEGIDKSRILAHLTCIGADEKTIHEHIHALKSNSITSIMALRGDRKEGIPEQESAYPHAVDLIRAIKAAGPFCIGAACYPEGHPESVSQQDDLKHLMEKQKAGADFLTTQMFFDNDVLYSFLYKLREHGVTIPVVPGIMPITSAGQIKRSLDLSGCIMPRRFLNLVDRFGQTPEAMKQAGILYAADQIIDLYANGIRHVHVYTMNKPDVAEKIVSHLSAILGRPF